MTQLSNRYLEFSKAVYVHCIGYNGEMRSWRESLRDPWVSEYIHFSERPGFVGNLRMWKYEREIVGGFKDV
jgi:hypothetical protein